MAEATAMISEPITAIVLVDNTDKVIAVNDEWQQLQVNTGPVVIGCTIQELATGLPELQEWISQQSKSSGTTARREFISNGLQLQAQLQVLQGQQTQRLLIITARPASDEDVYGRLRHDIKNRIGGLKLYATFLKRKLGEQTELLDVVGKMINSLDQMTAEANKIRKLEGDGK